MALSITRGTTYNLGYQHQTDGENASLEGCTLYLTVKTAEYDSDAIDSSAVIKKTLTDADFTDAANGYTVIKLTDLDTAYKTGTTEYIDPGLDYIYDIRVKEANGYTYKRFEGDVTFDGSPTNRNVS